MHKYSYQLPSTKGSTKQILILDELEEPIYSMKRAYKTIFHQLFDLWIGKNQFICELEGRDQKGDLLVQCRKKTFSYKKIKNSFKNK